MQRHNRLRLGERLGIGRMPRAIGQSFTNADQKLRQVDLLIAELGQVANLLDHCAGRLERELQVDPSSAMYCRTSANARITRALPARPLTGLAFKNASNLRMEFR